MKAKYAGDTLQVFMDDVFEYPDHEGIGRMCAEVGGRWFRVMDKDGRTIGAEFLDVKGMKVPQGYIVGQLRLSGLSDVAKLLGITKQRMRHVREKEDFPLPIARISSGPVWLTEEVEEFLEGWDRRPGRRMENAA